MAAMILLSLASLWSVGESSIGSAARAVRELNLEHFSNVIDSVLPLEPVGGRDETLYDHLERDEVVFLDKECARNSSYADHLRRELLLEQRCLHENGNLPGIVEGADYYHFYLQWNSSKAIDCGNGVTIDFEAFCISMIEFEPIVTAVDGGECRAEHIPNEGGAWFFDDIEGDIDDGVYSSPFFGSEQNLIVYVLDTYTLLSHEHFAHIPDGNKQYLGDRNVADGSNHGTHVAGSMVGRHYGVIRDPTVKLKACNCLPGGSGSFSLIEACLVAAKEDLESEQQSNPAARGVINMSLGGSGCSTYLSAVIQQLKAIGGLTVVAAGNSNADACTYSPACLPDVLTVGAYGSSHQRAYFSNFGDCVDAWAPGMEIRSSIATDGQYDEYQGTSMASPIMSGMVGQLLNLNEELTLDAIKDIVADDDHSYPISDCQSAQCAAFTVECAEWDSFSSGTRSPTVTRRPTPMPTSPTSMPSAEPMATISCGQTLTGTVGNSPDSVSHRFVNDAVQSVTFTDCDSSFDPKMFLIDSDGDRIQDRSTNRCDGDDCAAASCSTSYRETFTMSDLAAGSYQVLLTPYNAGGAWSITVQCHAPTESPTPMPPPTISCGQTLTGTVGCSPDSVTRRFVNDQVQSVTFTNCDSTFDPKMFLIDSDGDRIQDRSTNGCDGDDCYDSSCTTYYRETFTMNDLEVGSYDLFLTPYSRGGAWSMTVQCHGPSSSARSISVLPWHSHSDHGHDHDHEHHHDHDHDHDHNHHHNHSHDHSHGGHGHEHSPTARPTTSIAEEAAFAVDMGEWTGKDVVILALVAVNLVTIMAAYCWCSRSEARRCGKGKYMKVVAVADEEDTDLEAVALRQ